MYANVRFDYKIEIDRHICNRRDPPVTRVHQV